MLTRERQTESPWKLRGLPLRIALIAGAAFLAGAALAAAADLSSRVGWDSPMLQAWTLIPQAVAATGLLFLGQRCNSKAFYILGALIVLIVIEEAFHVLNPVEAAFGSMGSWLSGWSGLSLRVARLALVYGLVLLVGGAMLVYAHRYGSVDERPIVWVVALLLLVGGFFGGPISTVASEGYRPRWVFFEELGEAVVFAVIAGYVIGLIVRLLGPTPSGPRPTHP